MKKKHTGISPAIRLLLMAWAQNCKAIAYSRDREHSAMDQAWELAITGGFVFNENDLVNIEKETPASYHQPRNVFGHFGDFAFEHCYEMAVRFGNIGACRAFEAYLKRPPFIADHVSVPYDSRYSRLSGNRARSRLALRYSFRHKGEDVFVTSFSECGGYLVACSYHPNDNQMYRGTKVKCRHKITLALLRERSKEIREARKAQKERGE